MRALILALISIPAFAATLDVTGRFQQDFFIAVVGYESAAKCSADQGRWDEGYCWFPASNQVRIASTGTGYNLSIETVATNAHTCEFSALAKRFPDGVLVASLPSEEYDPRSGGFVKATCEVTVSFADADTVNVTNNGKCQSFCGARASLVVTGAKRVR